MNKLDNNKKKVKKFVKDNKNLKDNYNEIY